VYAKLFGKLTLIGSALVLPPLLGVYLQGKPMADYLEFPPVPRYAAHAPFSWGVFVLFAGIALLLVGPLLLAWLRARPEPSPRPSRPRRFPWWGWLGVLLVTVSWTLAWTRMPWFGSLQHHTFTPLWLGFILTVNAMTWHRSGRCLLTHHTKLFLALFPISSLFWWLFEYLNRFLQNWVYLGIEHSTPGQYVLFSSLCFSTVLPAVLGVVEWFRSFPRLNAAFAEGWRLPALGTRDYGLLFLLGAGALLGAAVWPDYLFPMVWVAPLLVVVGVQGLFGEDTLLDPLRMGDWRVLALPALAALVCGFFWELWNSQSLAHWDYAIPYVDRFHLFEMPVLGYAGYLPFGLEAAAATSLLPGGRWVFQS